jgi:hypothetical protein
MLFADAILASALVGAPFEPLEDRVRIECVQTSQPPAPRPQPQG